MEFKLLGFLRCQEGEEVQCVEPLTPSGGFARDPRPESRDRVLIMEDDSGLARGLKMILSEQGCDVELADTGYAALDFCMRKDVDILVADLRLPDMDGMEIIRMLKEKRPDMRVLVITGYASIDTAVESFRCGASDYLPKPFTTSEFKNAMASALKERQGALSKESGTGRKERLIQRLEVLRILENRYLDFLIWQEFKDGGSGRAKKYRLSGEAGTQPEAAWNC